VGNRGKKKRSRRGAFTKTTTCTVRKKRSTVENEGTFKTRRRGMGRWLVGGDKTEKGCAPGQSETNVVWGAREEGPVTLVFCLLGNGAGSPHPPKKRQGHKDMRKGPTKKKGEAGCPKNNASAREQCLGGQKPRKKSCAQKAGGKDTNT